MSGTKLKEELHDLIERADDRMLRIIHAMIKADAKEVPELSEAHKTILEDRLQSHQSDPSSGSSWNDAKTRLRSNL